MSKEVVRILEQNGHKVSWLLRVPYLVLIAGCVLAGSLLAQLVVHL